MFLIVIFVIEIVGLVDLGFFLACYIIMKGQVDCRMVFKLQCKVVDHD